MQDDDPLTVFVLIAIDEFGYNVSVTVHSTMEGARRKEVLMRADPRYQVEDMEDICILSFETAERSIDP